MTAEHDGQEQRCGRTSKGGNRGSDCAREPIGNQVCEEGAGGENGNDHKLSMIGN